MCETHGIGMPVKHGRDKCSVVLLEGAMLGRFWKSTGKAMTGNHGRGSNARESRKREQCRGSTGRGRNAWQFQECEQCQEVTQREQCDKLE